jgi:ribulose 1,5-bisphosphate synthetase/thiazole synthase
VARISISESFLWNSFSRTVEGISLERFENIVLGGGEAGKYIAWELARSGQRVAVIEIVILASILATLCFRKTSLPGRLL